MSAQFGATGAGATAAIGSGPSGITTPTEASTSVKLEFCRYRRGVVAAAAVHVEARGQFGAEVDAAEIALQAEAELAGEVAVFALARGIRVREVVEFLFGRAGSPGPSGGTDSSCGLRR